MTWKKEGDVMRLRDKLGYTRAFVYLEKNAPYYAVFVLGAAVEGHLFEARGSNKRQLMAHVVQVVKRVGYL